MSLRLLSENFTLLDGENKWLEVKVKQAPRENYYNDFCVIFSSGMWFHWHTMELVLHFLGVWSDTYTIRILHGNDTNRCLKLILIYSWSANMNKNENKIHLEMTFMKRFSEEKMPAAWSNKDVPFSDLSCPPKIICQKDEKANH